MSSLETVHQLLSQPKFLQVWHFGFLSGQHICKSADDMVSDSVSWPVVLTTSTQAWANEQWDPHL